MDPTKERIVIIAHSQGGIICSAWVVRASAPDGALFQH